MVLTEVDYTQLTHTYMGIFDTQGFYQFLNTSQTGFAHNNTGTDLSLLVKTVCTSLSLCVIQVTMFCFFRNIFNTLYEPRCHCVPVNERIEPLPKGLVNWIFPILSHNIHHYLSLGLDAYFFVRYINVLLLFFVVVGILNIIILVPINACGSNHEFVASGLDKFSISNISATKVHYVNAHFVMSLLTIGFFHWLIIYELQSVIKIRQSYLFSSKHRSSVISKTVLITRIPNHMLNLESLTNMLSLISGGLQTVWFIDDSSKTIRSVEKANQAIKYLELAEINYIKNYHRNNSVPYRKHLYNNLTGPKFYPPINFKIKLPYTSYNWRISLYGIFRIFAFQKRVNQIDWANQRLGQAKLAIEREKIKLVSGCLDRSSSIFVQFKTQTAAYTAHQCLLSEHQGFMDKTLVEVHPKDIQWRNLTKRSTIVCLIQRYLVTTGCILLIVLYVVPVSFIGLMSHLPLLTKLIPFLKWIYNLPEEARESISGILPSILLTILTEAMMIIFRFLTYYKGKLTGAEIELDLHRWYFGFLFIQQFLIVAISSSITVIFKQIVDQPTSIPVMLATNIPKAAIFFFQFIAVKAFAFCGYNFLRIDQLVLRNTLYRIIDTTPRMKFSRLTNLLKIKWGTTYPVYSVYASIGLVYTIISPLISLFIIFILFLVLLYYKYSLRFIYSSSNPSDTYGKLYPTALFHLYSGIYCLECCVIGILFLSTDTNGEFSLKIQGWCMCIVLMVTIFGNITLYHRYIKYFQYLPIIHEKGYEQALEDNNDDKLDFNSKLQMVYLHPSFKYEIPKIWLPEDSLNVAQEEVGRLEELGVEGVVQGASIRFGWFSGIKITEGPPDYK